jgi:hypothetical protein
MTSETLLAWSVPVAERIGFTTRILHHTLDFEYVMPNWDPDVVAIQMERPDQQEIEILQYLEKIKYPGRLLMTGDVKLNALGGAARTAGEK